MPENTPFGPTGQLVYERTYSRLKPDGSRETWPDTVKRVVTGNMALVHGSDETRWSPEVVAEAEKLTAYMERFAIIPGGRHLWATGVPGRQYLFNCHVAGWGARLSKHFEFTFLRLMEGGGVGSNYSAKYISGYGCPKKRVRLGVWAFHSHADYKELEPFCLKDGDEDADACWYPVDDSREGWASSLSRLINYAMSDAGDQQIIFDLCDIRPSGSPLKTFGGTASGPVPLARMLHEVAGILNDAYDKGMLTPLHAMEIDHVIAECVVSGGNRRSARMAIVHWKDDSIFEFINCKKDPSKHWTTNISVEVDNDFFSHLDVLDFSPDGVHAKKVHMAVVSGMLTNGEPGYWNSSLSQEGEVGEVIATNPCGEIPLQSWENCFDGDTEVITREGVLRLRELEGAITEVWFKGAWHKATGHKFGIQPVQLVTFAPARNSTGTEYQKTRAKYRRNIIVTPDHRWDTQRGLVNDLRVGDVVQSSSAAPAEYEFTKDGFRHGIIFGDGSHSKNNVYRARLFGAKAQYAAEFDKITYLEKAGVPEVWITSETNLKDLPDPARSPAYMAGFIDGWIATAGTRRKNGSVVIGTTSELAVEWLERHAASLGWVVRGIARHDGRTNFGQRNARLHYVTLAKEGAWMVESLEDLDAREVFCMNVPGTERFTLGNGIETHNCNLGHVNLDAFSPATADDYINEYELSEAHRLITRFLIRATYGDVNDPEQAAQLARNRRIGVGHLGVQAFWAKRGVAYSTLADSRIFIHDTRRMYDTVRREAQEYAFKLRIPEPVKVTTMAPTGAISKLPGVSEGMHPIYARHFENRIRFSRRDPAQVKTISEMRDQGYKVEDDVYDTSGMTAVVVIPTEDPLVSQVRDMGLPVSLVESTDEIPVETMLRIQAMYQEHWADNAVSCTINIPAGTVTHQELYQLLKLYLPILKGTTIMVDESRPQAPYTRITQEAYDSATGKAVSDSIDLECASGACPIR